MIEKIIDFSIKNKTIIGFFTVVLIVWGSYSLTQLPIDALPDITNNQVQVITVAPTLAAQEVERFITYPVETSVATIPDVIELRSISRFGLSVVTIVFKDEVDIYKARQMVNERLKEAENQIPEELGKPELAPVTTGLGEIYQYVLHTKPGYDSVFNAMELRTIQDWIVRRQLLGTPGVADVSSFGGYVKQYEIAVNPEKLKSMNITLKEIFEALERNNENTGGAYIDKKPNAYFIRGIGIVTSIDDIEKIVVRMNPIGIPILIRDIAGVQYGHQIRYGAMTRNDEGEVVGGLVLMLKGANSSEVIKKVKERIATIEKTLPEGVVIEPFLDRTKLVDNAIGTVTTNLIEGGLIVVFVLVLLLGNLRAGLVVASVIPLSMLFAVSMMNLFGVSGNLMSLGAIDFGLIVDGAVIIVESIVHRITMSMHYQSGTRELSSGEMDNEVYESSRGMMQSAAFGQLIILIVYLPILALVGIEGKMFRPMAQTVSFAVLGALLLSLTYVPVISTLFLSKRTEHKRNISDRIMDLFQKWYQPTIQIALKRKKLVLGLSGILLIISVFMFDQMGGEFIPTLEEGDYATETRLISGTSLSQTVETMQQGSAILLKQFPEVKEVIGKIGSSEIPTDPMPIESGDMMIILKDREEWTSANTREELAEKMSEALEVIPGVEFGFQQPIQMRFNELMTGARQDVAVKIFGEDLDVLSESGEKVAKLIRPIEGVEDVFVEKITGLPQIQVQYNRDKISQYGLNISDVNRVIKTAFAGDKAGVVFEGERRFEMVVRLDKNYRQSLDDVRALYVSLPSGNQIPIEQVADVEFKLGPAQISREDAKRRMVVGFNVRNRDVQSVVEEIQKKLEKKIKLPAGYFITYGGQFQNLIEAKRRLAVAVPVALALIFVILFFTFKSMKDTLLIYTAIPLSSIGGVAALYIRDMPFSISAGVGFIALFGVAVLNGIVLISHFKQLEKAGESDITQRVIKGTRSRLRPVILTAAVASLGFLPMAISTSGGAEVQKPLATVVIGGLISATLLTLVVLPVLYVVFSRFGQIRKIAATGLVLFLFIGSPASEYAQTSAMNLDDAIKTALSNNLSVSSAKQRLKQQHILKKASWDLGETIFSYERGQINGETKDRVWRINQNFQFPTSYLSQTAMVSAQIKTGEQELRFTERELIKNVKSVYFQIAYGYERLHLFEFQDSIYRRLAGAAELKYKTGESSHLEKLSVESRLLQVQNELLKMRSVLASYHNELQKLLNTRDSVHIVDRQLKKAELNISKDSASLHNNPMLSVLQSRITVNRAKTKVENAQWLPDLSVGYFSQSINGKKGFEGFEVGLSIPLWFMPQLAKSQSVRMDEMISRTDYEFAKINLEKELQIQIQIYNQNLQSVEYYEKLALPQAELILENGHKSYIAGSINYFEYVQNITQAIQLKFDYLETLNNYNQTIITIQSMTGIQ